MKREQIDSKYKWNLNHIINGDKEFDRLYALAEKDVDCCAKFSGKLDNIETVKEMLDADQKMSMTLERLYCYAAMHSDENTKDNLYLSMQNKVENLLMRYSSNNAFIIPELISYDEAVLLDYSKNIKDYDKFFNDIVREKAHTLSKEEEKILAESMEVTGSFSSIFSILDNADLDFPKIKVDGKPVKLTHATFSLLMQNNNRKVRETAFKQYYKTYSKMLLTITAIYSGNLKKDAFIARVRKFDSCLDKALFFEDVSPVVYNNLIKSVSSNLNVLHQYVNLRKNVLGYKQLHMYDMYTPLVENADIKLEYEKAFELVLKGLEPLGSDYKEGLLKSYNEGYIDVFENEGKQSGAYSNSCYGVYPYVLLNYEKTTHDVFTIAHELGHSMHSFYSAKNQPYIKANYTIFLAEVASTVNEVLLLKHILSTTTDKNVIKYLLSYYLDMFRTTLFRQTMFSEFELIAHNLTENNEAVNSDTLSEKYYELNKKYYGSALVHDKEIAIEWARIPHFYRAFYVYKYATGLTAAVNIANQILTDNKDAVANYKKFLSSGGSGSPVELLKIAGVDLSKSEPYEFAMKEFSDTLNKLKELF